ncbi:DUF2125 domain-containing protein [Celeribacter indicus]|uniref:DUF2125 domain-containing protein n=1 Tax=Celeribacter indicus TaxID=1208324 RepID=A0A0B5DY21_9RHOB|nr:DUF2125 domain-containing protein [Celeribacter indicus]AJE45112.1 hypothetical protein P73_0397 [Celeribacter indicus]SDX27203.1 hypothetical protein SAMN05443573_11971 [Celeribacter indicus]
MQSRILAAALSTTCLVGAPALADVTPEDVWESYRDMMTATGMEVSADESRDGETLVVRNMIYSMTIETPTGPVTTSATAPELRFEQLPRGEVSLRFASPITTISRVPEDPALGTPAFESRAEMTIEGETVVSGDPRDMVYATQGGAVVMTSAPVEVDGQQLQPGVRLAIDQIDGNFSLVREQETLRSETDFTAGTFTYGIDPFTSEGATVEAAFTASGITGTGNFSISDAGTPGDMAAFLGGGVMDFTLKAGKSSSTMRVTGAEDNAPLDILANTGPTDLAITLDKGILTYDAAAQKVDLSFAGPQIPGQQAQLVVNRYAAGLTFPMGASDADQPFRLKLALEEVTLPPIAWAMLDPQNEMPHDPATLRFELGGTVQSDIAFYDMEQISRLESEGEEAVTPKTVKIPELFLSLAGARISGSGDGRFLDKAPAIPGGLPPFAGTLSLNLKGVPTLIDRLANSGLLPQETAMSAQMMLGMFARPGEAPDELVSELELTEQGQIVANGQPLPF